MKKFILFLGILVFIDIVFFAYINSSSEYILYYPFLKTFNINSGATLAIMGFYGALGATLICYYFISKLEEKLKKQSRTAEKASIETTESSDKVKQLEAKIETLEAALKSLTK